MPYAHGAIIEHEFDGAKLNIWLTFRHPMDQNVKPALNLWTLTVDTVDKAISDSDWVDEFTLWLESVATVAYPTRVLLAYDGPSGNLQTTWGKDWEPWGNALSTDIGKGKCFVDRGDPAAADFDKTDFTADATYRDLDLSGIVPEGAKAVVFLLYIDNALVGSPARFRTAGNANEVNTAQASTQVAGIPLVVDLVCPLSAARHIEYYFRAVVWINIFFTVKGWWF